MKNLLCFIALVCLLGSSTVKSQIPLTLGWSEIPNTKLQSVALDAASYKVITAWGGGVLDSQRSRLIVWGGGHNDYSGNEIYAVNLSGTPSPQRLTNSTNPSGCGLPSCDGGITPNSRHTYHNFTYVPSADSMFVFGGGNAGSGVTSYNDAWQFRFADSKWIHLNPISTGMFDSPTYFIYFVEYYAPMDAVLIVGQYGLYKYDLNTKTMTVLRATGGGTGYAYGAIDPVKQRLYIFDQAFTQNTWVDLTGADGYAYHGFTPTGDVGQLNTGFMGWAYDPVSGDIVGWAGGDIVYRYNTTANSVGVVASYGGGPGARQPNGTYGRWQYVPSLGVFAIVNDFNQNIFTFRLNGGSPPPPAPPACPLTVGPGKQFSTIGAAVAAAGACGYIDVDAGIYLNESITTSKNLFLRGVGGLAHIKWGTGDYRTNTANIPNGKGLLVTSGNSTVENFEFSGAKVADENGAGIRYEGGSLTLRNVHSHDNQNGILGQGGLSNTLTIEHSVFNANGFCSSGGFCAHNLYIGTMGRLIFRHSKSVNPTSGHALKSRAHVNEILYNFISTKNSDGSYEADFPNGGTVYFIGNVVEQGANTGNSSMVGWGAEGATNPNPELRVVNNTFYNWRTSGATCVQVNGSVALSIKNNIFAGGCVQLVGGATDLASNKTSSDFVNAAAGDFHLTSASDAINAGVPPGTAGTYDLNPFWEYVDPAGRTARTLVGTIDVGAYESNFAPPPPPSDPCVTSPMAVPTGLKWPTSRTGNRSLTWNSSTTVIVGIDYRWPIGGSQSAKFFNDQGCSVTVAKP